MTDAQMAEGFAGFMAAFAEKLGTVDKQKRGRLRQQFFEAIDAIASGLAKSFEPLPLPDDEGAVRRLVGQLTESLYMSDPYDEIADMKEERDRLLEVLAEIRSDIRKGDVEHAILLVDYEMR